MASLEAVDYNPIDHLNALFGHPSTLSSVSTVRHTLAVHQHELDVEINSLVAKQAASDSDSISRIQAAKADLDLLFRKIDDVQARAAETERTISEMTADIKRLDGTKRNLTLSMTALKRLQMLTTAYEQLGGLSSARQYRECAQLLQAVIQLMAHFRTYRSVDQIAELSRNVSDIQRQLLEQVCEDFEITFAKGEVEQKRLMLAEGCLVMDALGDNARSRLITWYCNTQLREYRQLFRASEEAGSLDNISRRYAWFKRLLKTHDDQHAVLFPAYWHVDEILANSFSDSTKDDYRSILSKAVRQKGEGQSLDPNLLLASLQETLDFEQSLEQRFRRASRQSVDTVASTEEQRQPYTHVMSEAFEPYLSVWIEAQDKTLDAMVSKYKTRPPLGADEQFNPQMVITTSTELFGVYRSLLAQCLKLSTGQQLVELSKVFGKYLQRYAQAVLLAHITEKPAAAGHTPSRKPTEEDLVLVLNTADYCYSTSTQLEERIKSRVDDKFRDEIDLETQADEFMGIANAALRGLVRKIELGLEPDWRAMRNMSWSKIEAVGDPSNYVTDMRTHLLERVGATLNLIHKQQYARAFSDNVVELLATAFTANAMQCKPVSEVGAEQMLIDHLSLSKVAEQVIVANTITPSSPSASRSSSEGTRSTSAPAGFVKRANQTMSRVQPLLKTLQVRPSPPESLVSAYLIHVADKSDTNFRKVLDLKGVRKADQAQLMELFVAHKESPRYTSLPAQSAFLTPLVVMSGGGAGTGGSGGGGSASSGTGTPSAIGSLAGLPSLHSAAAVAAAARSPGLPAIWDGASLGTAFLSAGAAVREGVDKLGAATPGLSTAASRTASPQPAVSAAADGALGPGPGSGSTAAAAAPSSSSSGSAGQGQEAALVSQNLRNFGKFFKRDLGTFGGRFGGGGGNSGGGGGGGGAATAQKSAAGDATK